MDNIKSLFVRKSSFERWGMIWFDQILGPHCGDFDQKLFWKVKWTIWVISIMSNQLVRTRGNTREKWHDSYPSNRPTKRNGSHHFLLLFRIPYLSEEKWGNEPACQKWNSQFWLEHCNWGKWTVLVGRKRQRDLSIWLPTKILEYLAWCDGKHSIFHYIRTSQPTNNIKTFTFVTDDACHKCCSFPSKFFSIY